MDTFTQIIKLLTDSSEVIHLLIILLISFFIWKYSTLLKLNQELIENIAEKKVLNTTQHADVLRFSQLFEKTIGISVQGYNRERQVIYWNDASKFLYGYSAEQAIGQQLEDLIIPHDMREEVIAGINAWIDDGTPIPSSELSLKKSDGSKVSVFSNHFSLLNQNNEIELYCIDIDLSELKKIEKQKQKLLQSKKNTEAANQAKSEFLAKISHELRTPMQGILSYAYVGRNMIKTSTMEDNLRYFNNIITCCDRLLILVNDLLDLAKIEAGKMEMNHTQGSLKILIISCVAEQHARLNERKQKIIYIPGNISGEGNFDDIRIGQVITNLLSNAIKFSPENGKIEFTISHTKIESSNTTKLPALFVSIRDHGNGILKGEHELVFDKFAQSSDINIASIKGTGLGLPICKEIIELHHGKIWVENHPDGGAVFSFIIPVDQVEREETEE